MTSCAAARRQPARWAGNFAGVWKIGCPLSGNTWALKCFIRETPGLRDRYREISTHLSRVKLPFTVDFSYLERGIRVRGEWFPALKMQWVEGLTLDQFVKDHLERPRMLRQLLGLWVKLAARLRETDTAHADLQHGNVLLVPMPRGQLALKLIDYDGMHVPSLAGTRSHERGHPGYQHPQRLREGTYNIDVDRFSHLAIYCGIHCLSIGRKPLWQRFNNDDNLLFREEDFRDPGGSDLFRSLWELEGNGRPRTGRPADTRVQGTARRGAVVGGFPHPRGGPPADPPGGSSGRRASCGPPAAAAACGPTGHRRSRAGQESALVGLPAVKARRRDRAGRLGDDA